MVRKWAAALSAVVLVGCGGGQAITGRVAQGTARSAIEAVEVRHGEATVSAARLGDDGAFRVVVPEGRGYDLALRARDGAAVRIATFDVCDGEGTHDWGRVDLPASVERRLDGAPKSGPADTGAPSQNPDPGPSTGGDGDGQPSTGGDGDGQPSTGGDGDGQPSGEGEGEGERGDGLTAEGDAATFERPLPDRCGG